MNFYGFLLNILTLNQFCLSSIDIYNIRERVLVYYTAYTLLVVCLRRCIHSQNEEGLHVHTRYVTRNRIQRSHRFNCTDSNTALDIYHIEHPLNTALSQR